MVRERYHEAMPSKTETAARRLVAELYRARLNGSSTRNRLVARLGDARAKRFLLQNSLRP